MKLAKLLAPWIKGQIIDCDISNVKNDSRLIKPGDLFIAYPGAVADGRLFIAKAVNSGAAAIVYDPINIPDTCVLATTIPCIAVPHLVEKLAEIASRFYNNPSSALNVTGVTGTNGKTTIAYQLAQAHHLLGHKSGYIGTIGQGEVDSLMPLENTTPDALCLQNLLFHYQQKGIKQVCMEVSSHALSQHRVDEIEFKQAIFTNLTLDHLDYHRTMDAYAAAKAELFANDSLEFVILNQDDEHQQIMYSAIKPHVKKFSYGMQQNADVRAVKWHMDINGTEIEIHSPWGEYQLRITALGAFNIYNSLAVFTSLILSGYTPTQTIDVMARLKAAPGRMEVVAQAPYVLVDYAHTPDALENALNTLSQLKKGHLWVVFGCGGDRDRTKRPIMGKAAMLYADHVIVTSDNPRNEDPKTIIDEILNGIPPSSQVTQLINREEAIAYALNHASSDDIILIAGKGHEAYQQIGSMKHHFSDQEIVQKMIMAC